VRDTCFVFTSTSHCVSARSQSAAAASNADAERDPAASTLCMNALFANPRDAGGQDSKAARPPPCRPERLVASSVFAMPSSTGTARSSTATCAGVPACGTSAAIRTCWKPTASTDSV
jgi:hypothetical protein